MAEIDAICGVNSSGAWQSQALTWYEKMERKLFLVALIM